MKAEEREFICMGCGTFHMIPVEQIRLEYVEMIDRKRLREIYCSRCGCELILIEEDPPRS